MSQKLLNSYTQFLDGNGNPLAGGSLVFSETGTATPKVVYAAENQTNSLGSTVTLDSAGRPSSGGSVTEVYSAATGAYRITVKDASGTNVVVTENVSALQEFSALTMTGQLKLDDSTSTSAPPLTFDGDTDTGLARPAANTLAFSTGGTERARFTSTGNFGVGVQAPVVAIEANGSVACQNAGDRFIVNPSSGISDPGGTFGFNEGTSVANSGTVTQVVDAPSGGRWCGIVACGATSVSNATNRETALIYITDDGQTEVAADSNGSGSSFTLGYSSGTLTLTNTSGGTAHMSLVVLGGSRTF